MVWLYKVAYDGTKFSGSQIQPDKITVEGEIEKLIGTRAKLLSRTDKGVSARGNILMTKKKLNIGEMNSQLRHIVIWAEAEVKSLPKIKHRHYRYYLFDYTLHQIKTLEKFQGTHDFAKFTRARKNTVRTIRIKTGKNYCDFFSRGFLWNQIRRIVGTLNKGQLAEPTPLILLDIIFEGEVIWLTEMKWLTYFKREYRRVRDRLSVLSEILRF